MHTPAPFLKNWPLALALAGLLVAQLACSLGETTTPATLAAQSSAPPASTATVPAPAQTDTPAPTHTNTPTLTHTNTPAPDYFTPEYPLSPISYVIPLTVRHVTENSATLFFELSQPVEGRLVYRSSDPGAPQQGELALAPGETRQMFTLEGLAPGAAYQVRVLLGEGPETFQQPGFTGQAWDPVGLRTASNEPPLRVGVLGDASFGDQATQQLVALMSGYDLDFVIHTGDVVYETDGSDLERSYTLKFFEPFAPLLHHMPVYTVLGNHDYDKVLRWQGAPFYDYAFPAFPDPAFSYPPDRRANQYYAFTYQGVQFLMLDSQVFYGVEGRDGQKEWLMQRLQDPRFRLTIPVFHVAPYSSSVVHPDDGRPMRLTWGPLFEAAGVRLSFSGHFHHYERLFANGVTYIVSGGGSSTLYAQGQSLPESQIYLRRTHFVLMEIYADRIQLSAISKEGETLDQAVISLP
ncbi:MAG: metallophosphoesterase [Chloroflexota bacterium]